MVKDEKEEQTPEQEPKKKGSLIKKILIVTVILVILATGVAGGLFYFTSKEATQKATPKPLIGTLVPMEPFIVNLIDNNGERYLKVVIQLEVSSQNVVQELEQLKPRLRDSILELLSAKSYKDLMDTGGKQRLREEIIMRLNSFLQTGKIDKIYFTELVVQ